MVEGDYIMVILYVLLQRKIPSTVCPGSSERKLQTDFFFIGRRLLGHTVCYLNIIMFRVQFICNGCKQTGFPLSCYASVEVTVPDKEELDVIMYLY